MGLGVGKCCGVKHILLRFKSNLNKFSQSLQNYLLSLSIQNQNSQNAIVRSGYTNVQRLSAVCVLH